MNDIEEAKFLLSHEKLVEYFDDGRIEFTCWINNEGNYDGPWDQWHESGGRRYEAAYKNGQLEGMCKSFYENGRLEFKKKYKNGKVVHDYN